MPDYKTMYITLFRSQIKAIHLLQEAQQATEEMFIESKDPDIRLLSELKDKAELPPDDEK